jgi:hypothetical protein
MPTPPVAELTLRLVLDGAALAAPARLTVVTVEAACVEIAAEARASLLAAAAAVAGVAARAGERRARMIYDARAPRMHDAAAQLVSDEETDTRGQTTRDRRIAVMSVGEKIQLAVHGNRDVRALLMRDRAGVVPR